MSTPRYRILSIQPRVQRLVSCRPNTDNSGPQFELIVRRNSFARQVSLGAEGTEYVFPLSFVARHKRSVRFRQHDQSEAAVRMALSFPEQDLYPTCGPKILSFVRETMRGGKLTVVATISCIAEYQINYDEELAVGLAEARSEEEARRRNRRKVAVAEIVLEEREWEGGDGEGSTCMCTVCLEEFGMRERVVRIACSHLFHKECIRRWLVEESNSCPLCRFEIE